MIKNIIDVHAISKAFESLSGLTQLSYYLFDDRGNAIIVPTKEDKIVSHLKRQKDGRELYDDFLMKTLRVAAKRRNPYIAKGPTQQLHIFIPIEYKSYKMIILVEAFYLSKDEFRKYVEGYWSKYFLDDKSLEQWMDDLVIIPHQQIEGVIRNINQLLNSLLTVSCENSDLDKRLLWFKTIINVVAKMRADSPMTEIYNNVLDAVIFLFNVDSAGIYAKSNGNYDALACSGRKRNILSTIKLPEENPYISKAYATRSPVSVMDSIELWHLGFPDEVISLYLFPIETGRDSLIFLGIFNSLLDNDAHNSISELCRLISYFCISRNEDIEIRRESEDLNYVCLLASELYTHIKESEKVYDIIVNEASSLIGAEKCSLMLPESKNNSLKIAAVKGINRVLIEDVRVKKGDGIAGYAFQKGVPILIDGEDGFKEYSVTPRSFYKTTSCMSVPLKIADDIVGILNLSDKGSGEPFSEEDISRLSHFVFQSSVLIQLSYYYEKSEIMKELSIKDPLTGIYNRRYFDMQIEEEFKRSERYGLTFSLAIVDIDDFKLFNDSEGHIAGDNILKEISSIMTATLRSHDILVRFGGEEFAIIMPQTSNSEAFNVAERIRHNIKERVIPTWKRFPKKHLTVSVGLAMYPSCGDKLLDIIKYADRALYKAKVKGKDQTISWQNFNKPPKDDDNGNDSVYDSRQHYL
jgi:diguanylate cyclase (GGDEF)-like protein